MKCCYCENEATKTLTWLKDRRQQPARIKVMWCGCDLMVALRRFWPNPYQVIEGRDYEVACDIPNATTREALKEADALIRVTELEDAIRYVVTQKFDDVCWLDVYVMLGKLVGIEYDPLLLPKKQFLHQCDHFYDCLAAGKVYETDEVTKRSREVE